MLKLHDGDNQGKPPLPPPRPDDDRKLILRKLQAEPRPASPPSPGAMAVGLVFGGRFR